MQFTDQQSSKGSSIWQSKQFTGSQKHRRLISANQNQVALSKKLKILTNHLPSELENGLNIHDE
tara:strand:+ start:137 stop:328 length:192 start_codon:yes stop_codon:yes gene_type:complete